MTSLSTRIQMGKTLKKLNKLWYDNNDVVAGKDLPQFIDTYKKLQVIRSLEACNCLETVGYDNSNRPVVIRRGSQSAIYAVERFELWFNRIGGFIAGIATTLIAQLLWHLIFPWIS